MMKQHFLLPFILLTLLGCATHQTNDPDLYVSGYYIENYNIPTHSFLEVENDSLHIIYPDYEAFRVKKPASNKDTVSTQNGFLIMQKRQSSLFLQSLNENKTKVSDLTFFPVAKTKPLDKDKVFQKLYNNTFETQIDRTVSSPNSDLLIKKSFTFEKDSVTIIYTYSYQEQLMHAEKEKIAYALIEKNNSLFLELDSSDAPNFKRMNQIIAINKHSFTLNHYRDREIIPEKYVKTQSNQQPEKTFKPCRDSRPGEYYFNNTNYDKGNVYLMNKIREKAPLTKGNGYITVHFTINCNKETGRFGVEQMNQFYEPATYDPELIKYLINEISLLKDWPDLKLDYYYQDIHAFLMFKIRDGKIVDLCP